jgi:hypothetical protein
LQRFRDTPVEVTGKKAFVTVPLSPGDLFIYKGKKGEAMLFKFKEYDKHKRLVAICPIDQRQWTLAGDQFGLICPTDQRQWTLAGGQFGLMEDVLNGTVKL